jgi:hypothetical protein
VHGLIPRHRRKAGSGPPATALIAWIGADPHLRSAIASAGRSRRETDLLPATTRMAKAAVAACFVLTYGAVLGITTVISDGLLMPLLPGEDNPPPVLSQGNAAPRGPGMSPLPAEKTGPYPSRGSSGPAAMAPMMVSLPTPQPDCSPPAAEHKALDRPGGRLAGSVPAGPISPPAHPVSPRRTKEAGTSPDPTETIESSTPRQPRGTDAPRDTDIPAPRGTSGGIATPGKTGPPPAPPPTTRTSGSGQRSTLAGHGSVSADGPSTHPGATSRPGTGSTGGSTPR